MFIYEITIILLMLVFNAAFSCYEMALASITHSRLNVLLNEKRKGAVDAVFMKEHMEQSLAVIQLGITLVGAIAAAVGGAGVEEAFAPYLIKTFYLSIGWANFISLIVFIVPLTFFTIIFGELFPKMFALNNKERVLLKLSPLFRSLTTLLSPITSIMENMVKRMVEITSRLKSKPLADEHSTLHELHAAASLARQAKIMGAREEKIVLAAAMLSTRTVKEIIIPIEDVSIIASSSKLSEALIHAHMDMHTRFPACTKPNDPQTIVGYINFKDIVAALKNNPTNPTVSGIMRPMKKIPQNTILSQLLEQMIQEKIHIVITADENNKITGLVTMEDILEELVGDIDNAYERLPVHIYSYESSWIIGGSAALNKVCEITKICIPENEQNMTIAEWWQKQTKEAFKESLMLGNYSIAARKYKRKKVAEVIITKNTP
jgi:putative hemolysin